MAFTSEWEVRSSSSFVPGSSFPAGVGQSGLEPLARDHYDSFLTLGMNLYLT
jgi:hypothetical protein